jgi:membrane-associated phospholipid phosphatase
LPETEQGVSRTGQNAVECSYTIHCSPAPPFFDKPLLTLTGYSFPSGHAMASTVLYGTLAVFVAQTSSDWRRRVVAVCMSASIIAIVCFSRIYLGVQLSE